MPVLGARLDPEVAEALELDVTGGEQDWDERVWRRMVGMRAVDVVQPDVCYLGD